MAKARVGLYNVKGEALERTHRSCPKCGPGTFLAEHKDPPVVRSMRLLGVQSPLGAQGALAPEGEARQGVAVTSSRRPPLK